MNKKIIRVIIPAFNEAESIAKVIGEIPIEMVSEVIVVDNGSDDDTFSIASQTGVTVLKEPRRGYGHACLKGINYIENQKSATDIIVFLDGDYSDYPEEMKFLVEELEAKEADLVIGSRALGQRSKGSMTFPQVFGNWLAARLIKLFWGVEFSDLGPFRAIRWGRLLELQMKDKTYGWTVEMQVKAAKLKYKCTEVPVSYRKRIGISKISGTVKGTIMAGYKIIWTIFKYL